MLVKKIWQARGDSNPQLSVLETDALPIELLAYNLFGRRILIQLPVLFKH